MGRWIRTVRLEDLSDERGTEAVAEGRLFAIFRVEGQPYALDALCCHQGGPLGKASICGFTATCPWHGWQYDVRTGRHVAIPTVVQPSFPTRVVDGWVEVELSDDSVAADDYVAR